MEPFIPCPPDAGAAAEAYLTNCLRPHEVRTFEEHLAVCPRCAEMVEDARAALPVSMVHQTEDGPVHLWALPDRGGNQEGEQEGGQGGEWKARIWGRQLAGARRFQSLAEANRHLLDSFARMFPHHLCTGGRCQHLDEAAQESAAAHMQFWDYWK